MTDNTQNIWVISDTHFGHENIIKYCDRPFRNSREMDYLIREEWNAVVKPQDKVYHLGDVYFNTYKENPDYWISFLNSLNGKKRLVLGNHDNAKDQVLQRTFQKITAWRMFRDLKVLLTHVPVHPSSLNRGVRGNTDGTLLRNVHGHTHLNGAADYTGNYLSACVEIIDYKPIHLETLLQIR